MRVYLGADWSASEVVCAIATDDSEPRSVGAAGRSVDSVRALLHHVRERQDDITEIHAFIEVGAPGWVEILHDAGAHVHVVDAKQAKAFAESLCSSAAKDDARDASVLAQLGRERCDRLAQWSPPSDISIELRELAWLHEKRSQTCRSEVQRLRSKLRESFPQLEAVLANLTAGWTLRLLRAVPTPYHAARLSRKSFDELMWGSRQSTRNTVWSALTSVEEGRESEDVAEVRAFVLRTLLNEIEQQREVIVELERRLDAATEDLIERPLLESIGGVGVKMSNRLLELAFDGATVPEHRDEASIRLGASPVFRGSGKGKRGRPKGIVIMRRSASSRAQATTYLLGRLATQHLGWARAKYAWDMQHNKGSARSYRGIARSLLRIMTAILKSGEPYDDARYVSRLKNKGQQWAMGL